MKKKLRTLLALVLAVCMLAGCGSTAGKEESKAPATSSSQAQASTPAASSSAAPVEESKYPEYLNMDSYRPIVNEGEEITLKMAIFASSIATTPFEDRWFYNFIEEELNINLEVEVLSSTNVSERTNLMLGTADLPDMMLNLYIGNPEIVQYGVGDGLFLPMSDYIDEELTPNITKLLADNPDAAAACVAPDGKMYTVPMVGSAPHGADSHYNTYIDTEMMKAAGIEEVPDTVDEFIDMLRAFKNLDPAQFGVDEIWPMITVRQLDGYFLQETFGWATDNRKTTSVPVWDVYNKEVAIPAMTEAYIDYLTMLNTMYTEGLLHPDYYTMDQETARAYCAEGKAGVCSDWSIGTYTMTDFAKYVSVSPLKTKWSGEGVATVYPTYSVGDIQISADTEYPELCMRLLDYFYSEEGAAYSYFGPVKGSEDCLGLVDGYTIVDGQINYGDAGAKYASPIEYQANHIMFFDYSLTNIAEKAAFEMAGETYTVKPLNPEDPGDWDYITVLEATEAYHQAPLPSVYPDPELSAEYGDLQTLIQSHVDTETAKFVVGQRPLSEFADFQKELKDLGGDRYLEIAQGYYANYVRE